MGKWAGEAPRDTRDLPMGRRGGAWLAEWLDGL